MFGKRKCVEWIFNRCQSIQSISNTLMRMTHCYASAHHNVVFACMCCLLSTFLTHFLIPSTFRTNRHTNQVTRYISSILRIPDFARARTRARRPRVFTAYLFLVSPFSMPTIIHVATNAGRPFKTLRICFSYRKVKWKCSPISPYFEFFSTSSQHTTRMPNANSQRSARP